MIPRLGLLYLPVLAFMTGLASMFISLCLAEPKPTGEVGPTGSDALCFWYVVPHTILWLIVGVVTLFHVPRRVSMHWSNSPSQQLQAIFGLLGGVGMSLIGAGALPAGAHFTQVFAFSCVISSVPCAVFFGIATVVYAIYSKKSGVDVTSIPDF